MGQTGTGILLSQIPNSQALLNIRFTNDSAVRVTNASITAYDRSATGNMPSGITVAMYEVNHTGITQTNNGSGSPGQPTISGAHRWWTWDGSDATGAMSLIDSPGTSGLSPSGSSTVDTRHDFYCAISCSPNSIGSKLFAASVSLEYL